MAGWFHRPGGFSDYWIRLERATAITAALALPFIRAGVALTLRRLRAARLPLRLVVVFFLPVVNLAFFVLLEKQPRPPDPGKSLGQRCSGHPGDSRYRYTHHCDCRFRDRLRLGFVRGVALLPGPDLGPDVGYHAPRSLGNCITVACASVVLLAAGLLALAIEGIICLLMAGPLALVLAMMGGAIGYLIQRRPEHKSHAPATLLVALASSRR